MTEFLGDEYEKSDASSVDVMSNALVCQTLRDRAFRDFPINYRNATLSKS